MVPKWIPPLIAHPESHRNWSEFALTVLITGAAWIVADLRSRVATNDDEPHGRVAVNFGTPDQADVGFGVEAAARQFHLDFVRLVTEDYFFVCRKQFLETEAMKRVLAIIRGEEFQAAISRLQVRPPAVIAQPVEATRGVRSAPPTGQAARQGNNGLPVQMRDACLGRAQYRVCPGQGIAVHPG